MFEPTDGPRVFGMAPGVDFPAALVTGLEDRMRGTTPEDWARVEIFVNTARMQRRLRAIFDAGPPRLLPRIRLVTDLADDPAGLSVPPAVSPLRRRLELSRAVALLLEKEPDIALRASLYALSDSLATLMDEMQGEGVPVAALDALDVSDQSGHWARALTFLKLLRPYTDSTTGAPDREARQRRVVAARIAEWERAPPSHPVLIAGSTGSRGTTRMLMQAVARLPLGAVVLPGFDANLPEEVWRSLAAAGTAQDHPQTHLQRFLADVGMAPRDVVNWGGEPPDPARNRLISLSLRPAPVTDQWRIEGPELGDLRTATRDLTLIEAPSPRAEAESIALGLRQALDEGLTAALITPDRMLTRQVAAALDRWSLKPDDSAGVPLALSAPGRLLRQVAEAMGQPMTGEMLLSLLKHPLVATGGRDRNDHLRLTRDLELSLRRHRPPRIDAAALADWADRDETRQRWVGWLAPILTALASVANDELGALTETHFRLTEALAMPSDAPDTGELWRQAPGREALRTMEALRRDADAGGPMAPRDYAHLLSGIIAEGSVRDPDTGDPRILIWGTLEARVQGVDLVILAGLNEGVWPRLPDPDPWLNRTLRDRIGLLLPDRQIALAAHDYQQAIAAPRVWLSRAVRSTDAPTVPSRWLNRLTNLMEGLPEQHGPAALRKMREKGQRVIARAARLAEPEMSLPKARRPSPVPPVDRRPKRLSVTQIKTLIRDPYAIYAQKILRLIPLDPLRATSDPSLKGRVFHAILEDVIKALPDPAAADAIERLLAIADAHLARDCPWPVVRLHWRTQLETLAPTFLAGEVARQRLATPRIFEGDGSAVMEGTGVTLSARIDRVDVSPEGRAMIYDYKTGQVPSAKVQRSFDKQLLLLAGMVERGAIDGLPAMPVAGAAFLGIKVDARIVPAPLDEISPSEAWEEVRRWLGGWNDPDRGYTARRAMMRGTDISDYDHLSRRDEWSLADKGERIVLR